MLPEYRARFLRSNRPPRKGKSALIVDDGLATGATTEAAVRSAKNRDAAAVIVAAPVASDNAVERLERVADRVLVLFVDPEFDAVGRSEEHTSELQSLTNLVCRLLLEKKKKTTPERKSTHLKTN